MINKIIGFSIRNKAIIGLFILALIFGGIYSISQIPLDAVPDITDNQVQVITFAPNLATQEVEQLITTRVELALSNLEGREQIRSISRFGLSVITVVFEESVDPYLARQLISERLNGINADLPPGIVGPEMGPLATGLAEVYQYYLKVEPGYDSLYSAMELRTIQDWIVRRQLLGVEGVIDVNSAGGFLKQFEISFDPGRISAAGLDVADLETAILMNNQNVGGSYIRKGEYNYFIRGQGLLQNLEDIRNIPVATRNGVPILVNDVAEVGYGFAPRFGAVTANGKGETVAGAVMMLKGENSAEVTKRVEERVDEIQSILPEGVKIVPFLNRLDLIARTTKTVRNNLIEGGLIVIFILVLFLGNLRAGLIVASVIPLSLLFAFILMNIFGVSANLMSLGAIDFGLIVDGAVIIVESIVHRLHQEFPAKRVDRKQLKESVFKSATKIRSSAAFGEIIILIVYLPILTLSGVEGKMFKPMAQTVSFAILGALILSMTYIPMMSAWLLTGKVTNKKTISDRIVEFLQKLYEPTLRVAMKFKLSVLTATVILFSGSVYLLSTMGGEFLPTLEEGDFALHQILPPGSSVEEGVAVSKHLQEILLEFPEVETVVTKIGTSEIPFDVMPVEAGDIFVKMKPKDEWETADNREEMFVAMEEKMEDFPGVTYEFTQPIQMRFNELMTGVRQDIAIKIFGDDLGQLLKLGQEAEQLIRGIDGVGDIQLERVGGLPQIIIDYEHSQLQKNGLTVVEVNRVVETAFAGMKLGKIYEGERSFDLVLRMQEENRHDIEDVKQLLVPMPNGSHIPLSSLADVHMEDGPAQISREGTHRRIVIGVNARDRDVESLVSEIETVLERGLDLPSGYYLTYGGQFENLQEAKDRLSMAVPAALLLILFLLYLTFGSFKQSLIIFTAVPMAAIGGVLSLYLRGMPFSISAGVGFIALFGVAVLNGIVLIAYFNQLKEEGLSDLDQRIKRGTMVRLRPVFMTALVASMGFLPMALSNTAGGEVQRPLATVVIGGLITSTLLTLLVIPILYYYSEKLKFRFRPSKGAIIVGFLIVVMGLESQSQVSLPEAIEIAWQNNPSVRESALSWEQAVQQQKSVALFQPTQITYSREEFDKNTPGIRSIQLYQQINSPLAYSARKQWRKAMGKVGFQAFEVKQNDMAYEIAQAYLSVLYQRQFYLLADSIYQNADLLFEKVDRRFEVGDIGKLEWMAISNQFLVFEQGRLSAKAQKKGAEEVFTLILNDSSELMPKEQGLSEWNPVEDLFDPNLIHPTVAMGARKVESAEANVKTQRSQYFPGAIASFKYQQVSGNWGFWGYQIGAVIPLVGNGQKSKVEAAKINVAQAEAALESTKLELEKGKTQVRALLAAADSSRFIYESKIIPLSAEQIRLSSKAYELGEISYVELIQQWQNALQNFQSYYDVLYRQQALRLELVYLNGGFMTLKINSNE